MRKSWLKKGLVFGIIMLFVGTSLVPCINAGWDKKTTELVSVQTNKNSINPSIAVDPYGGVHAAWSDWSDAKGDYDIFYNYRDPSTGKWLSKIEVVSTESDQDAGSVSLAVEDLHSGQQVRVHVAWADNSDINGCGLGPNIFYKSKLKGAPSWPTGPGATEVVSTESDKPTNFPSLAVDINGRVHIAWTDYMDYPPYDTDSNSDIVYKCRDPITLWPTGPGATEVVSTESDKNASAPSLDLGYNGSVVHIAWHDYSNLTNDNDISNNMPDIFYKCKTGSWPTTTELVSTESDREALYPSLAWDQYTDTVHVAWMDKTWFINPRTQHSAGTYYKICYKYKDVTWSTTELVSTESTQPADYPSLDTDSYSRVHIAWRDRTTTIPNAGVKWNNPCGPTSNIFYKSKPKTSTDWYMFSDVVSTDGVNWSDSPCLVIASNDSIHIAWHDNSPNFPYPYHDILYKLGAGTPYSISLSPPTSCKILLRGFGLLDSTHTPGIYDLNLKDYCVVMFPLFDVFHRVQIGSSASTYLVHLPADFCYTHGEFLTPLPPTGFFSGQILGNTNFDSIQLYTSTFGFIIHTVTLQSPFSITGRSYP